MTQNPTIEVDAKIGDWRVLRIVHRRALCKCRCNSVHEVSIDALASGQSVSCGCSPLSKNKNQSQPRLIPDWRPQR